MSLILVGGIDPTGRAGLARDIATCRALHVHPAPVPSCLTVQTSRSLAAVHPTAPGLLERLLEAAAAETHARWAKVGAIVDRAQAKVIVQWAKRHQIRLVVDPVLSATAGGTFCRPEDLQPLLDEAFLITPNQEEAERLGLEDGPRVHITRGGVLPGEHRGTGCRYTTRVAGLLTVGLEPDEAIALAHRDLEAELTLDAAEQAMVGPRMQHWLETRTAMWRIFAELRREHIPEVGINLAHAMPGATDPDTDVCGLAGRLTIAGDDMAWSGRIAFGGPQHTGRIAVVLQEYDPEMRLVMNHRHEQAYVDAAVRGGLVAVGFHRDEEPADAPSSMEWGVRACIERNGGSVPDLVWDPGSVGKEPMIRVFARDGADMVRKLQAMHAVESPVGDPDGRPRGGLATAPFA